MSEDMSEHRRHQSDQPILETSDKQLNEPSQQIALAAAAVSDAVEQEEEAIARTTRTEKSLDGGRTTTTTTTTTHKTKDGPRLVTKQTRHVTRVGGIGSTNYTIVKPQADEIASRLAASFELKSIPGLSGMITVRTESWNSSDGVTVRCQKSRVWPASRANDSMNNDLTDGTNYPPSAQSQTRLSQGVTMTEKEDTSSQEVLDWIKTIVGHYEYVNVANLSSSWNDGMAFCALVHHFFPDAFDYSLLKPVNRRSNLQLAFQSAKKYADITPLLNVEDMLENPDWRSVFTYLQSFYSRFVALESHSMPQQQQALDKPSVTCSAMS